MNPTIPEAFMNIENINNKLSKPFFGVINRPPTKMVKEDDLSKTTFIIKSLGKISLKAKVVKIINFNVYNFYWLMVDSSTVEGKKLKHIELCGYKITTEAKEYFEKVLEENPKLKFNSTFSLYIYKRI